MRSNLINLQNTAKLMEQTAVRLNTGKKVNTALDDPISYFTAKGHMSRSADLATLKNGMSEGIQTINAANIGIEGVISLIEAAKSKAEAAKSSEAAGSDPTTSTITLTSITAGDAITIGGQEYTACAATPSADHQFAIISGSDSLTALSLAAAVSSDSAGTDMDVTGVSSNTISFEDDGGADMDADSITFTDTDAFSETLVTSSDDRTTLVAQYAELMSQIDQLKNDSGYKGINLLEADDTLTVKFEGTNNIEVAGFDGDVLGLGLAAEADNTWTTSTNINDDIILLDAAIETLESQASALASSLSIVTTRQDFTASMINTLTTGADNLTLADMNEEGANMLMLQTQQALGTNSLSLAAQTAQSVLRLF
jgi:flagellin